MRQDPREQNLKRGVEILCDAGHAAFPHGQSAGSRLQLGRLETSADGAVLTSVAAVVACSVEPSFIPSFRARMPSPIPLPSSGSFLGPNTSKAIKKITRRCIGWKRPSNIQTSIQTH